MIETPGDAAARADQDGRERGFRTAGAAKEVKRAAAYWAAMDAEKAEAIAQRLPDGYVNRVFAQMSPDAVADIMNALPAKVAARLTADSGAQAAH